MNCKFATVPAEGPEPLPGRQTLPARLVLLPLSILLLSSSSVLPQKLSDGFHPDITNTVMAVAVQADGKILVGGEFLSVGGVSRTNIARLNPDGTLDAGFVSSVATRFDSSARPVLLIQKDGKILLNGPGGALSRLNANGALDAGFHAATNGGTITLQADGKILVSTFQKGFRLESDGSLDPQFLAIEPGFGIAATLEQPDGKLLVAGGPLAPGYQIVKRFHPDGALDTNFNASVRLPFDIVEYSHVSSLAMQRDGKVLIGGWFSYVSEQSRFDFARLNRNGSLDVNFFPGPYEQVNSGIPRVILVQPDGKILAVTTTLRRHLPDGRPDPGFSFVWNGGNSPDVRCVALQADGKILLGGRFTSTNGAPARGLLRLYPDGTLDEDFQEPAIPARALAMQPDGKLLVGTIGSSVEGDFTGNFLGRYTIAGAKDASFQPNVNSNLHGICVQGDGRVAAVGQFYRVGGQERLYAARVNEAGSLDINFDAHLSSGVLQWAWAVTQQDDGKLILGGSFSTVGGQAVPKLVRFQTNGSIDGNFSSSVFSAANCTDCSSVDQIIPQPDGKLLISGAFKLLGGGGRTNLVRLNANGTLDSTFVPQVSGRIDALQRDGKVLVEVATSGSRRLVRLHPDGSLDALFSVTLAGSVSCAAAQADGKIVISIALNAPSGEDVILRLNADGSEDLTFARMDEGFLFPDGITLQSDGKVLLHGPFGIRRMSNPTPALQALAFDPGVNTLLWRRSGSSPEVERVVFERSLDGTNYTFLGTGTPVPEGWRLADVALPVFTNVFVRARGRISTGWNNASSSLLESIAQFQVGPPMPRLVLTGHQPGPGGFVEYHFANPLGLRFGLLTTTNVSLPEYQWRRLPDPEPDIFDLEGRYWFWDATTNSRRFYKLTAP